MNDGLIVAIARARARLNAAIALHRALAWLAPASIAAAILVAAARALAIGPVEGSLCFGIWAALSLAGFAAGALISRSAFLDDEGAARWLDERLDDGEILAAALCCLGRGAVLGASRGAEGGFDEAVVARAEEALPRAAEARPSGKPLARKALRSLAALAIGAYLVFLAGTAELPRYAQSARAKSGASAERGAASKSSAMEAAIEEGGKAASDFASSLFPGDRRMATLTERALREGRLDDLRELLKAAGLEVDAKIAGSLSENERKKLAREREKLSDAESSLSLAAASGLAGKDGRRGGGGDSGGDRPGGAYPPGAYGSPYGVPGGSARGGGRAPGPGQGGTGPGQGGVADGSSSHGAGAGAGGSVGPVGDGKSGWGTGSGSEGDWGEIEPLEGSGEMTIAASKDPGFFELVLPGSDAARPVSELAPSSRKSAEAAMSREGLPLDYEDFVRSYYLQLSKGESR
jgi:hypothetical protein